MGSDPKHSFWDRVFTCEFGSWELARKKNTEVFYRRHVSEEEEKKLDDLISQQRARDLIGEINKIKVMEESIIKKTSRATTFCRSLNIDDTLCQIEEYVREQLPEVDFDKYEVAGVLVYLSDRYHRE